MNVIPTTETLTLQLVRALKRYSEAKVAFMDTTERLSDTTLSQRESSQNARDRTQAIADCQWHATDVQTIAAALSALCLSKRGRTDEHG